MKWLVKRIDFTIEYTEEWNLTQVEANKNKIHNEIAKMGQDGWEPWHMLGSFIASQNREYIAVWFKRPDEFNEFEQVEEKARAEGIMNRLTSGTQVINA